MTTHLFARAWVGAADVEGRERELLGGGGREDPHDDLVDWFVGGLKDGIWSIGLLVD